MSSPFYSEADTDTVTAVRLLWELCTPVVDIARRLKLDQATTLFIIENGRLPARQLTLNFDQQQQEVQHAVT